MVFGFGGLQATGQAGGWRGEGKGMEMGMGSEEGRRVQKVLRLRLE